MNSSISTLQPTTWKPAVVCAYAKCVLAKLQEPAHGDPVSPSTDSLELFARALKDVTLRHVLEGSDDDRLAFQDLQLALEEEPLSERVEFLVGEALRTTTSLRILDVAAAFTAEGHIRVELEHLYQSLHTTSKEADLFADEVYNLYVAAWARAATGNVPLAASTLRLATST